MLAVVIWLAWRQEKSWLVVELTPELEAGLQPEIYEMAVSYRRRLGARLKALARADLRGWRRQHHLLQTATDLAFTKHRLGAGTGTGRDRERMERLRARLQTPQAQLRA